ncbi:MAG TPA: peptidylprolyl isomerase [Candidatus Acidoferrales bacterium]|jgi:peptidyl-prolyl cis-trans isomerase SurA|nr:peptidylprolyl isomerase [Candidatus Acidoferrales bacterium]
MKKRNAFLTYIAVGSIGLAGFALAAPSDVRAQAKGMVVEEIVARVNNDAITLSDVQKADQSLHEEIVHDCPGCSPDKVDEVYKEKQKDLLRDLVDQALLTERAKDMGISVETDVIKRLDELRKQNNLGSMEDMEKEVEKQGLSWEDLKTQIRNNLLTQEVIRREVGSHINIPSDEVKKYYDEHQKDFVRPEQVVLAEIFLSTEGKSPEEMSSVEKKAEDLRNRVVKGEDFNEIAKHFSEGSTAKDGGNLGTFEHGQLSKQLEDIVFQMNKGQMTEVTQTKTGFEVLKVEAHFEAGLQPQDKVENEIMNRIYAQKMQPTMREYLGQLREQSYVMVKPGYTDSAAVAGASVIQEVAPTPDAAEAKKKKKMAKPKINGQ